MSTISDGTERLREISDRLRQIASALGEEDLDDRAVIEMAEEAARLTGEAVERTEAEVTASEKRE